MDGTMDGIFNSPEAEVQNPEFDNSVDAAKEEKKAKKAILKDALIETIKTNPEYLKVKNTLSDSVEVINTFGYGDGGNIVEDKSAKKDPTKERVLKAAPKTVGYRIKNVGDQAIEYVTETYAKDENGIYVGSQVKKTLAPGATADLTRQYMTMFCLKEEISFVLKNGKIIASSKKNPKTMKEQLEAYYFSFNRQEDGTSINVNDDDVKISIDVDGVVQDEYLETFGYLNNPKVEGRNSQGNKPQFTTQDLTSNFLRKALQEKGML